MKKKNLILLLLAIVFFPILKVDALSLNYNLPEEVNLGETFKVEISVDDNDLLIKAIEGVLSFDFNSFELVNINSPFNEWIKEPYLNEDNKIYFSGLFDSILNNNIFNLVFKKNKDAVFELGLDSGTILADDELFSIDKIVPLSGGIFNISSPTHPDSKVWYNESKVKLNWMVPSDASKIKILIDENEEAYPSVEYSDPIISEKEIELDDGVWYFHIRYFGDDQWSDIETKKIMIDTEKPKDFDFYIKDKVINFISEEDLSYELIISSINQEYTALENSFDFSFLKSGEYIVLVKAYDRARNYIEKQILIKIEGVPSPHFSGAILDKNNLYISGYIEIDDAKVITSISGEDMNKQEVLKVSSDGKFVYYIEDLKPGLYYLNLFAVKDSNLSEENKKVILIVDNSIDCKVIAEILIGYGLAILALLLIYILGGKDKKIKKNKK
ncbi:MAG: hypothetical protein PHG24_00140 [Candidatus Pacebacteria bacterium]|nr:hypothetical protein [Candidatus Paceibacterota bacterium]